MILLRSPACGAACLHDPFIEPPTSNYGNGGVFTRCCYIQGAVVIFSGREPQEPFMITTPGWLYARVTPLSRSNKHYAMVAS
jgi:hypothetical protein